MSSPAPSSPPVSPAPAPSRKRPAKGERRLQILQALAARLEVSEAALYRHFASKAQMLEGLIDYIETSLFGLIRQIQERPEPPAQQAAQVVAVVLQFAERNPSMARLMAGDALVLEHERLQQRMSRLHDKLEAALRQCLRPPLPDAAHTPDAEAARTVAAVLTDFMLGRLQRFVRSGFERRPTAQLQACLDHLL